MSKNHDLTDKEIRECQPEYLRLRTVGGEITGAVLALWRRLPDQTKRAFIAVSTNAPGI